MAGALSLIADFRAALSKVTGGVWADVAKVSSTQQAIGGFESDADAAFVVTAFKAAPLVGPAYDLLKAVNGRSILGVTYLTKANRDAIAALVKGFEA